MVIWCISFASCLRRAGVAERIGNRMVLRGSDSDVSFGRGHRSLRRSISSSWSKCEIVVANKLDLSTRDPEQPVQHGTLVWVCVCQDLSSAQAAYRPACSPTGEAVDVATTLCPAPSSGVHASEALPCSRQRCSRSCGYSLRAACLAIGGRSDMGPLCSFEPTVVHGNEAAFSAPLTQPSIPRLL